MPDIIVDRSQGIYEGMIRAGNRLADTPEEEGGWAPYFGITEDGTDLTIEDPIMRSHTAIMLENCKQWMADLCRPRQTAEGRMVLDEATRSALVGGFSDYLFPIIRAAFPTNPINELISVQPTNRRTATVIYWNYMIGTSKGNYVKGQRIFDAQVGRQDTGFHYSDETIEGENPGAVRSNSNATLTGTLTFHTGGGLRPNTVQIVADTTTAGTARVFYDTGNGGFTSPGLTISAGSINYMTGVFAITLSGDTFSSDTTTTATYEWDSEASCDLPEMDLQITTSTATTQRRAMKINYSIEAMQDVMAEMGVALEPNLIQACAEQMNYEIARQIIHELWINAPIIATWPITGPTNFSQQQYFGDIVYVLNRASNSIWERTQKAYANWMVVDSGAATVIQSLPNNMFVAAPSAGAQQGLFFIGTLQGQWRVYKDLLLKNEPGASAYGNILLGYKGNNFFDAGFVWAPYQLLYTTDSIPTPCFTVQKGMATRYATKMVNPNMYAKIALAA